MNNATYCGSVVEIDNSPDMMQRTFATSSQNDSPQDAFLRGYNAKNTGPMGWPQLLESRRILLVAEAGAGKTHECREQARQLFEQGEAAFFLRLEEVAAKGIVACLYGERRRRFEAWRASAFQRGFFFLDSIDELQLAHADFRDALDRVAHDLEGAEGRCTILVTSRPVDIDRRAFSELLRPPTPIVVDDKGEEFVRIAVQGARSNGNDRPPETREVNLEPLSDEQILEFARKQGVASPGALLAAIHARHAGDFARRPQDLIELCDNWRDHGEIRTHFEQVKSHVRARLNPRPDRKEKADLTEERARDGAQRLALAAMLSRRLTIRHSAGADVEGSGDAPLAPSVLLSNWGSAPEIAALLERPIFGEAGYGRVRFHHRSVLEFLAASQIDKLIKSGTLALSAAKRMLFSLSDTQVRLMKPSMRPVAGWLALLRQDIFDAVLDVEPSTLLLHGDPESLNQPQCERALRAFVARYGHGQWRGLEVPELQLERLASKPLHEVVLSAWNAGIENPEVRQLLVKLIGAGRYGACADLAVSIARSPASDDIERFESLLALASLKDHRLDTLIDAAVSLQPGWTACTARWIATKLYPEHVSEDQLLRLLANVQEETRRDDYFASSFASVVELAAVEKNRLEALLPGLLSLTRSLVVVADEELVERRNRLKASYILRALCIRLLKMGSVAPELIEASVLAYRAAGEVELDGDRKRELSQLLNALPAERRRLVFEADCLCISLLEPRRAPHLILSRLTFQGPLAFSSETDQAWILGELAQKDADRARRSLLLHLAVHLTPSKAEDASAFEVLRGAVKDSGPLLDELEHFIKSAKPSPQMLEMLEQHRKREERQKARITAETEDWTAFWRELTNRTALALAPGRLENTVWNLWLVLRKKSQGSDEGRWDRAFLEQTFSISVTNALRRGLMNYWRGMKPTLRPERQADQKNTYLMVWSIGLMGVYAEAEEDGWAKKLSAEEAELAVRYALLEMNGLPDWLSALAEAHGTVVDRVLGAELEDELAGSGGDNGWHSMLLQGLRYGRPAVAHLMQPRLLRWLQGPGRLLMQQPHRQIDESKIDQIISVLLKHGDQTLRLWLQELATLQASAAGYGRYLFFWLPLLFRLSPVRCTALLLPMLEVLPVERRSPAVQAIGSLFASRHIEGTTDWSTELPANTLLSLTQAFHRHVSPEADHDHDGVYTPDFRDNAEDARRYVLDALIKARGTEAFKAKLVLAVDPMFAHAKDRIAALAHERLAEETDASIAEMDELAGLFMGNELVPKSGTDMAHTLNDRLDDLQDLMLRDTGPRAAWAMVTDENSLRPAITRELEIMAKGAYTVDQEAVTADSKETDIRFRAISMHQATIELKIGEKSRSGKELRDTIEDQLVTKYMAHSKARTGCLLVTVADPEKRWQHPETGATLDWQQLQMMLNEAAQLAQQRLGGDARVMARVLNLTPRLGTEASTAAQVTGQRRHPAGARPDAKSPRAARRK